MTEHESEPSPMRSVIKRNVIENSDSMGTRTGSFEAFRTNVAFKLGGRNQSQLEVDLNRKKSSEIRRKETVTTMEMEGDSPLNPSTKQ